MRIPTHTYPSGTLYLSFNPPPDDLRLESLGRTSMGFGPRSFRPTASERIQQNMKRVASLPGCARPATSRVESLPGPINQRSYLVQPSTFDIRVGRATDLVVPFTMTSGLAMPKYRAATPRIESRPPPSTAMPLRLQPLSATLHQVGASSGYRFGTIGSAGR